MRVAVFIDIMPDTTSGPLPAIRLATAPAHGVVTVKRATLNAANIKQCLVIDVPAFVVLYRAAADCSGPDSFERDIVVPDGRKPRQCVEVIVAPAPNANQGI